MNKEKIVKIKVVKINDVFSRLEFDIPDNIRKELRKIIDNNKLLLSDEELKSEVQNG